jgi:hypothetical protein
MRGFGKFPVWVRVVSLVAATLVLLIIGIVAGAAAADRDGIPART